MTTYPCYVSLKNRIIPKCKTLENILAPAVRTCSERERPRHNCAEDSQLQVLAAFQKEEEAEAKAAVASCAPKGKVHVLMEQSSGDSTHPTEDILAGGDVPVLFNSDGYKPTERGCQWEGKLIEMDTTNPLKVKCGSFSTFNKNIFSFEALEVLSHIFSLLL